MAKPACFALAALLFACSTPAEDRPADLGATPARRAAGTFAARPEAAEPRRETTAQAAPDELRLLTWNLEWFMDPEHGPSDDARQREGAVQALSQLDADLVCLQEIGSEAALAALLQALPEYRGVLSSYRFPQRLALLYRAPFTRVAVSELTGLQDTGRPPLEVELRDERDGSTWFVVVVHAKAYADDASWQIREQLAQGLHALLARRHPDARVIVAGDFNDGLLTSITTGRPSPYAAFTADPQYLASTLELERRASEPSNVHGAVIDHVLFGRGLAPRLIANSADVLRDELLARDPALSSEVSDHFPVAVRLR